MKRFRADRAINTRILNFPDVNNHLAEILIEYLSHSLGLSSDTPGTNTVIGLLKSFMVDLSVLEGLKEWLQEQVNENLIEEAKQAQFNEWVKEHIEHQAEVDTNIQNIRKAISLIMNILNIFGSVEIPPGVIPQYNYNPNFDPNNDEEFEEFINALEEIVTNGWFKSKSYTKNEVDTILNHYLRDDASITLTYPLILQNTSFTLGNKTIFSILDAGGFGHTDLPTVGYVSDAITNAFSSTMTNYYTKSEVNTILNHYLRDDSSITLTYPLILQNTSFTLGNITVSSILDAGGFGHTDLPTVGYMSDAITNAFSSTMVNYYTKTETDTILNHYLRDDSSITLTYPLILQNTSFTLGNITVSGILDAGSSGHTELPTVGYVNDAIANAGSSSLTNYYTKSEIDTILNHYLRDDTTITLTYPLNLPSFTLGNITISSILDAGGFGHTDLPTVGYMSNAITNAFSSTMVNYYTKTEIDTNFVTANAFSSTMSGYYTKTEVDALISANSSYFGDITINFKYLISTTGSFNITTAVTAGQIQFSSTRNTCYLTSTFLCPPDNTPDISDIYITSIAFSNSSYTPKSGFVWPATAVNSSAKALSCSLQEHVGRGYHIMYKGDSDGTMWSLAPGRIVSVVQLPFDLVV